MANQHYDVNEEFEVNLRLKVKLKSISNYYYLSEEQIKSNIETAKEEMEEFLKNKIAKEYRSEDLTERVDYWNFEVFFD